MLLAVRHLVLNGALEKFGELLKKLSHDILTHFFDGLNCGSSAEKK